MVRSCIILVGVRVGVGQRVELELFVEKLRDGTHQISLHVFFFDVVRGAGSKAFNGALFTSLARQNDDRYVRVIGDDAFGQLGPVHFGHVEIGDDEARLLFANAVDGFASVGGEPDAPGPAFGDRLDERANRRVVINE